MKRGSVRVGVHTSIAGDLENAVRRAAEIGCDTFQMFSANPRGWLAPEPSAEDCRRFRAAREASGLRPLVIHDNYLINLASAEAAVRKKSIAAFRREIRRAVKLGAEYLVAHPGSAKGSSAEDAVKTCAVSIQRASDGLEFGGLMILIENTAGQGTAIGRSFEEVAEIIQAAGRELPVGCCIDTAHCFAAGYAIHTPKGLRETVKALDQTVGLSRVRVIHANDSKAAFDSHVDRHEHIGKGAIGAEAFRRIVRHPKLRNIPFICETPVDEPDDDKRNVEMMRKLAAK